MTARNPTSTRSIRKLLVVNRGEIAVRIFKTCRKLGIRTVAIYSDADKYALHTRSADEKIHIGASEANQSYLSIPNVIEALKRSEADAVHPGYGFLSESAEFSAAVTASNAIFLGPTPEQMSALGDKEQAKTRAIALGIPVLQSERIVPGTIPALPFPLMIKARAGGGGRGMRIVRAAAEFASAVESAAREALAFFGDGTLFVERFIERARHVEVQLLGDGAGHVAVIGDRDCSAQRRHQKVLEEAPAFGLNAELRTKLHNDSSRLLSSVSYRGAGTAEFLVCGEEYFFLEVNSRLQVEHPVTEAVTGLDLVQLQIQIGEGQLLKDLLPQRVASTGHAIEVRICAERPSDNFAPATGTIAAVFKPSNHRFDTGFAALDTVSHYYDSLLGKLIVVGSSREEVINTIFTLLSAPLIIGVDTNQSFLRQIVSHPEFVAMQHSTRWIETIKLELPLTLEELISASGRKAAKAPSRLGFAERSALLAPLTPRGEADVAAAIKIQGLLPELIRTGRGDFLFSRGQSLAVAVISSSLSGRSDSSVTTQASGMLHAPLPGKIIEIKAAQGAFVEAGETVVILESMKMEHPIKAPISGKIQRMCVASQQVVEAGILVAEIVKS